MGIKWQSVHKQKERKIRKLEIGKGFLQQQFILQSLAFILTESHQPAVAGPASVTFARIWRRLLPKI